MMISHNVLGFSLLTLKKQMPAGYLLKCLHKHCLLMKRIKPEAAIRGVLYKKVFLKISQNSQENTSPRISFVIKMQAEAYSFIKKRLGVFLRIL